MVRNREDLTMDVWTITFRVRRHFWTKRENISIQLFASDQMSAISFARRLLGARKAFMLNAHKEG